MFGRISGATIKNLNVYYNGAVEFYDHSPYYAGGIAGCVDYNSYRETIIENCTVNNFTALQDYSPFCGVCGEGECSGTYLYIGGLVGYVWGKVADSSYYETLIKNCKVNNMKVDTTFNDGRSFVGGLVGHSTKLTISDCLVSGLDVFAGDSVYSSCGGAIGSLQYGSASNISISGVLTFGYVNCIGGAFGSLSASSCEGIISNVDIVSNGANAQGEFVGGIAGYISERPLSKCQYNGNITFSIKRGTTYIGGIVGASGGYGSVAIISECSFDGTIDIVNSPDGSTFVDGSVYIGGLVGRSQKSLSYYMSNIQYCTVNGTVKFTNYSTSTQYFANVCAYVDTSAQLNLKGIVINTNVTLTTISGASTPIKGVYYAAKDTTATVNITNCYYNSTLYGTSSDTVKLTSNQMRDKTNFSAMTEFDDYFVHVKNRNNGFPILQSLSKNYKITGFDGDGTEANPFQIKTTADLQAMQSNYNNLTEIEEYWWKLMNDIDISKDVNNLSIEWCPIAYEEGVATGFNGHFLGNNKTITGLTITEQYENVGLFGRLAPNATITNLTVSGTINWDQAKYVGGVVGLMEEGSTLTNCTFTGTITGYLNSGNLATVGGLAGKYTLDSITGRENYESYIYGKNNYTTFTRFVTTYTA